MTRYCITLFVSLFLFSSSVLAQTKFYTSFQYRSTQWDFLSLVDDNVSNDIFNSNYESFKTLDMNIAAGSSWKVGLLMEVGDFTGDISGLALKFGRKDWNFLYEKGNVSGHYQATMDNSSITFPQSDSFDSEYSMLAVYKEDSFINSGVAYISYSAPLPTYFEYEREVDYGGFTYTENEDYIYIDSESRMDILGWFVSTDALKTYMQDGIPLFDFGGVDGFFDIQYIFGLGFSTPSESNRPEFNGNESLTYKTKRSYLATSGGLTLGLMKVFDTAPGQKLGFSAGYQARMHGAADISFAESEMYTPTIDVGYFDVLHGVFFRASYIW